MEISIQKQVQSGILWSAIEKISFLGIQFIITIVIARVLTPEDYGLIGMLSIFTALGTVILDSGFGQALIGRKKVSNEDYSSVFFINLILGVLIYIFLYYTAPFIANFYKSPELINIARCIFLIFPINAFGLIHNTIINRSVDFKRLAIISACSSLLSGTIGIYLAYNGIGVWTLVIQTLLQSLFKTISLWFITKWRPLFIFRIQSVKEIFSFSVNLLMTDIIIVIFNNIHTLLIGKFYPTNQVGYYNQARTFEEIPPQTLTSIIQRVIYPLLAKLQENNNKLKEAYRTIINLTLFINLPMMLGLIAIAKNLFIVLLTSKWNSSILLFQLLCIYGSLYPLQTLNINILKVKAKGKLILKLEIFRRILMIIFIVLTVKKGITTLLVGYIISSALSIMVNMHFCGRNINLDLKTQIKDISKYLLAALLMASGMYLINFLNLNPILALSVQLSVGFLIYTVIAFTFKFEAIDYAKKILQNIKSL
jgi:O-antigen/teichoic acid export membrane protein